MALRGKVPILQVVLLFHFFFSLSPEFFSGSWYKSEKNSGDKLKKKLGELKKNSGVQELKFF